MGIDVTAATAARRRPSGEPPPLPRPVSTSTRLALAAAAALVVLWLVLATDTGVRVVTGLDLALLRGLERIRWDPLTDAADTIVLADTSIAFRVLGTAILVVLLATRRFQHLFAALALLLLLPVFASAVREQLGRMRPAGIEILGDWDGYAHPARPVGELTLVLTLAVVLLVPAGPWRRRAGLAAALVVGLLIAARLYVGVDHVTDDAAALVLGAALPVVVLRLLTPEEVFPVTYRRGVRAHLDVGGRRGEAIRTAFASQLGLDVVEVEPFSLAGSAGSTPLRVRTADGAVFAKLYARSHLRSDRWYKLARTVRYGRLEDERPFNSVRRLVQYEDHMLRVLRDAGVPTAAPLGIVEITPEREYLVVTELIPDAVSITELDVHDADATDDVVDQALAIVRTLWDAGLAHRDIKPANLLVAGGHVWLIDVAFAEVRPTPWRQAVDLANMLLTLALCVPPERVYERAVRVFTPDEIAEAFAASRAVTVPAQLRALLRAHPEDLAATFRSLAPQRPPVAIQRWTLRRLGLTLAVVAGVLGTASLMLDAVANASGAGEAGSGPDVMPGCDPDQRLAVVAQSVPTAAYVPCVRDLPAGWTFGTIEVGSGAATLSLESDRADRAVSIELVPTCGTRDATAITPSDEGVRTYQRIESLSPRYAGQFLDVFGGGCVVTRYDFERGAHLALVTELGESIGLYSRRELRQGLAAAYDVTFDP